MSTPHHHAGSERARAYEIEHKRRGRVTLLFGVLVLIAIVALAVALLGA